MISAVRALGCGLALLTCAAVLPQTPHGSALRYDHEYPFIGYSKVATHNPVARLQQRLDRGEVRLEFAQPRGYLDSLLSALKIDPSSQTLVYSKTSLQADLIRSTTPRAIYFNDDTYVAWIVGTSFLEIVTMDAALGPVFYTLANDQRSGTQFARETSRCLTCHDTFGMTGGGVPRLLFLSTLVDKNGESLTGKPGTDTTDRTPLRDRWAGWYVTGQHGEQTHFGNLLANAGDRQAKLDSLRRPNVASVAQFFDAKSYLTDKSDIVALLVFEHQAYVHSLITRANYKSRTVLARQGVVDASDASWSSLPEKAQTSIRAIVEPLVQAMLFVDAAPITSKITSTSGFDRWFQSQGPRDPQGRSLRELDLQTQLFRHPLSFLVYSENFDGLPHSVRELVYTRLAEILGGREQGPAYAHLSPSSRMELLEILTATKPEFAGFVQPVGAS